MGSGLDLSTLVTEEAVADAIRTPRGLEPYGLQFCEQPVPVWDWAGLIKIRHNSPVPVLERRQSLLASSMVRLRTPKLVNAR